ncbi:CBL-interacting protein kinase 32 [Porphyridium purpureum]|uniref:non-specific serine/threonine protein kinase n=1 Tax=Porphyridium purpureum TaxID=35688 RepID=A0A5J4YVV8_PORPP|nr:CBL-interacting protein kinase 32 [Porphyridium purpureum]|eukprot:POR3624..scf209_3
MSTEKGKNVASRVGPYLILGTISEGSQGKVKRATHIESGEPAAVKIMEKSELVERELTKNVRREIIIMRALSHPHIVRLKEVLSSSSKIYLVMELVVGGELTRFISDVAKRQDWELMRKWFRQIVDALEYCHRRGVCHRDLKPENILIDDNDNIKITDFGVAGIRQNVQSDSGLAHTTCGSPFFVAPEVLSGQGYVGMKADSWSLGVLLYLMVFGVLPFMANDMAGLYQQLLHGRVVFPRQAPMEVMDLILRLLERVPEHRLSMSEIKEHPWFLGTNVTDMEAAAKCNEQSQGKGPGRAPFRRKVLENNDSPPNTDGTGKKRTSRIGLLLARSGSGGSANATMSRQGSSNASDNSAFTEDSECNENVERTNMSNAAASAVDNAKRTMKRLSSSRRGRAPVTSKSASPLSNLPSGDSSFELAQVSQHQQLRGILRNRSAHVADCSPPSHQTLERSGSSIAEEGWPRDLRATYAGKSLHDFIAEALPGKPEHKIAEVVQKLTDADVDCVYDLQVVAETSKTSRATRGWLESKVGLPEVTAMRIARMFASE